MHLLKGQRHLVVEAVQKIRYQRRNPILRQIHQLFHKFNNPNLIKIEATKNYNQSLNLYSIIMHNQAKTKAKIDIQKSLGYLSNIISSKSQLRGQIDQQVQQITNERIQTIHKFQIDTDVNKNFISTEWNRHKLFPKSFRSPYTNNFFPPTQQSNVYPSPILRNLQEKGNILFNEYTKLYYGQDATISNFYVYDTEEGINVIFVIKKEYDDQTMKGVWSSTNFCQIRGDPLKSSTYKLMTSILYELELRLADNQGLVKISGSLRKNKADAKKPIQEYEIDEFHLMTVGRMVEENQTLLRQQLESVMLAKSRQISFKTRLIDSKEEEQRKISMGKQFVKLRSQSSKIVE